MLKSRGRGKLEREEGRVYLEEAQEGQVLGQDDLLTGRLKIDRKSKRQAEL